MIRFFLAGLLVATLPPGAGAARGANVVTGPVTARVVEVVDGDTLRVAARIWVGQDVETLVRVAGIDAPELRGACEAERRMARAARDLLAERLGDTVLLHDISHGKYAGRVVARVGFSDGGDVAAFLLKTGLARPYDGGRRLGWCAAAG